jgi:opacity protein-like surface antigen
MRFHAAVLLLVLACPSAAFAQDDRGAHAGGSASATNMDSRTSWSFAGSFEYRLNRVAGLEIEATAVPTLKSDFPGARILASSGVTGSAISVLTSPSSSVTSSIIFPTIFPQPRFANQRGRAVIFTNNVRVHIPTTADRLDPYFVAGGGISNVRHTADYIYNPFIYSSADLTALGLSVPIPSIPIRTITQPIRTSSNALALTIGGGVGVRVLSHLWVEGDLRMFRLLGNEDQNAGRFGVGVRYRF